MATESKVGRRAELEKLRDRVAKATGLNRPLDADIFCTIAHPDLFDRNKGDKLARILGRILVPIDDELTWVTVPRYTGSIDDAVTLVPEGMIWLRKSAEAMTIVREPTDPKEWGRHFDGGGATAALALCATRLEYELAALSEGK